MKSFRKELWFNLPNRIAFVNITPEVEQALAESGIKEGLVLVNAMHITASVFINDDESGLHHDYEEWLEGLARYTELEIWRQGFADGYTSLSETSQLSDFDNYSGFDNRWSQELSQIRRMASDDGDGRFYYSGMAQAYLLDRLAAGVVILYKAARVVNFAHGALYMLGAFGAFLLLQGLNKLSGAGLADALIATRAAAGIGTGCQARIGRHVAAVGEVAVEHLQLQHGCDLRANAFQPQQRRELGAALLARLRRAT